MPDFKCDEVFVLSQLPIWAARARADIEGFVTLESHNMTPLESAVEKLQAENARLRAELARREGE